MDLASSEAGPDSEDNSYLGYSLAMGDFTGNGGSDLAVGMPRAANLTGKVRKIKIEQFFWHIFISFITRDVKGNKIIPQMPKVFLMKEH